MVKKYKKIEFGFGNIEDAIHELKSHSELVCGLFNGVPLYSDIDDLESAYVKITGITKSELEEQETKRHQEYLEEEIKHREAIPELTKEWIEKGKNVLDEKYQDLWNQCVPIRLGDLYHGMELGNCLDIVEQLNKGEDFEKVKPLIENQGHSGTSYHLVCAMVASFCDRGKEFVKHINKI